MGVGWRSDGTLWQGAQLAIDTTMVSPLRRDGTPGQELQTTMVPFWRWHAAGDFSGETGRTRLVVVAAEVGGNWNSKTAQFITALANAPAQEACRAARAFCVSLLDCRPPGGTEEAIPSVHEGGPLSVNGGVLLFPTC